VHRLLLGVQPTQRWAAYDDIFLDLIISNCFVIAMEDHSIDQSFGLGSHQSGLCDDSLPSMWVVAFFTLAFFDRLPFTAFIGCITCEAVYGLPCLCKATTKAIFYCKRVTLSMIENSSMHFMEGAMMVHVIIALGHLLCWYPKVLGALRYIN